MVGQGGPQRAMGRICSVRNGEEVLNAVKIVDTQLCNSEVGGMRSQELKGGSVFYRVRHKPHSSKIE